MKTTLPRISKRRLLFFLAFLLAYISFTSVNGTKYYAFTNGNLDMNNGGPVTTAPYITNACVGSLVEIPITVTSFNNVGAISLTMNYDKNVMTYDSYSDDYNLIDYVDANETGTNGIVKISGFSIPGKFLDDGDILITLKFNYIGGNTSLVWDDTYDTWCEYASGAPDYTTYPDDPTSYYYINGSVAATGTITGTTPVCQSQNAVIYSVPAISGATYIWAYSGTGATLHDATTNSITIDFSSSATAGNLTVCGIGILSANYPISVNPIPTPSVTGPNIVCAIMGGYVYSTTYTAGRTYAWDVTGGTITNGAGTNAITVTWGSGSSGSAMVTESIISTLCSASNTMNVTFNPAPIPVVSGNTHVSLNSTETYATSGISDHSYVWSVTGGSLDSPQGSSSMDIWWGGIPGPGTVTVSETNSLTGCMATSTLVVTIGGPDVTPNITAEPNIMHGIQSFDIIIQVTELLNISTYGTITVLIPKDTRWIFSYLPTAEKINGKPVNNSDWNYAEVGIYHQFTSKSGMVINAGSYSKFGFIAVWNAGSTTGAYTITSQITSGSGGEIRVDNNVDAEKLDYFIY